MLTFLLVALATVLVLWPVVVYNRMVKQRNWVNEGWSNVDVQLKRRANLIPNLVAVVKGYAEHEMELLNRVIELRGRSVSAQTVPEQSRAQGLLGQMLARLLALAEAYPDLKANSQFLELQRQLTEIEDQIQLARRYYNGTVRNFNNTVETFPNNLIGRALGFESMPFFELKSAEDENVTGLKFDGMEALDDLSKDV